MTTALVKDVPHIEDPFGPSADPARYVPREATERALATLHERLVGERRCALLAGTPGMGKTLLLRILRQRLPAGLRVVHLVYTALPPDSLFAWALEELGAAPSEDPVASLVALAGEFAASGGALVLLVDNADLLPMETAEALVRAADASGGALRFVAAGDREALAPLAELMRATDPVLLAAPMSETQTREYVRAHLAAAGLTEAAAGVFHDAALSELHARADGVPARVGVEASELLRAALVSGEIVPAPPPAPSPPEAAFERAAGRLALAHDRESPAPPAAPDPAFERAVGRLVLNRESDGLVGPESVRSARTRSARVRWPSRSAAMGLFALCFVFGSSVGLFSLAPESTAPEPESPAPARAGGSAAKAPVPAPPRAKPAPAPAPASPVSVQINASPWAEILIDGERVGVTPLAGVQLAAGRHRFDALFPDGRRETRTLYIDAEQRFVVFPDPAAGAEAVPSASRSATSR